MEYPTTRQAKAARILYDGYAKLMLSAAAALGFVILTIAFAFNPNWPMAVVDGILVFTIKTVITHYFKKDK